MLLAGLSTLALANFVTPAAAQDAAAEEDDSNIIIVTATKRDANLQDIPFSINARRPPPTSRGRGR
jgi:outer membrane receptor protein involved in Fe transport